jgi:hypothetical protein
MATTQIPRVDDTDLDRDELVEAAEELDIEHESLDDQELFEELGRRLGEIEDDAGSGAEDAESTAEDVGEQAQSATSGAASTASASVPDPEELREELEGRTRDQVRDELRELGLPVSGTKGELVERLAAARIGAASAGRDTAGEVADEAGDTAREGAEEAGDTAEHATEQASDTAEHATEQASDTAAEVTPDRQAARDEQEYRVENDERENVAPILDLELGPLALDVLGLDIHLNRVHAVLVANPGPKHALLGKLLSGVAKTADMLGINSAVNGVTDGVEKVVDALPTPDTGDNDSDDDEDGDEDDKPGILGRVGNRIAGAGRAAKNLVGHATDAVGDAKDATVDAATSGGKLKAAKEAKDALGGAKDAGRAAKNVATGSG